MTFLCIEFCLFRAKILVVYNVILNEVYFVETLEILKNLAIILIAAKLCGLVVRKLHGPQVVGEIIAGLIVGPCLLNFVQYDNFIAGMAEIGVVLLMFAAGLGTDLKELVKTGFVSFMIALAGVVVSILGGAGIYLAFGFGEPGAQMLEAIFVGTILAATSVSITIQALKEMGHLKGKVATTILSAAVIDDVIGIVLLTVVIGFKDPKVQPLNVCINIVIFFALAIVVGFALYFLFKWLDKRWPHSRRIPIFGLVLCFACAYCAEEFFGIADITGAYVAGIILCNIKDSNYIERKMDVSSYMIFGPIFFASIGLQTSFDNFDMSMLWFSIALVAVALVTKVVGCGGTARLCRFNMTDSLKIGVGMMNRGEVGLIVAKKGLDTGLMSPEFFTPVIILIIVSSLATPILLKLIYTKWPDKKPDNALNTPHEKEKVYPQESVGATANITADQFQDNNE